ncbi:histamine H2 receptor [Neosynchiropus ocellatus]
MEDVVSLLYAVLMVLTGVASVGGNLLLLLALLLNKELWTDTTGLTLSISLSDLALALSTVPFGVYNSLARPAGYRSDGALCQGSGFIFLLLQTSSIHSLMWTTIDKFAEICFGLNYHNIWTRKRCRTVLVLVWSFSVIIAALPLLGFGSYSYSETRFLCCTGFTSHDQNFVLLWLLAGITTPIVAMCFLYGYIIYVARKQARRGTFMCNELHCYHVPANQYLKSSVVMVTTSVCLVVCWIPYIAVCLYETFSGSDSRVISCSLSTWLVITNAALNPWIICLTQT